MVAAGHRAVMLYLVQRGDTTASPSPATSTRPMPPPSTAPGRPASRCSPTTAALRLTKIAGRGARSPILGVTRRLFLRYRGESGHILAIERRGQSRWSTTSKRRSRRSRTTARSSCTARPASPACAAPGALVAECLDLIEPIVRPGLPTEVIDRFVYDFAMDHNALPATLGYKGYTKSSCTSINHVVCHGIPGDKPLRDGDIVNIDVTLILDGWHGDSSRMYKVGAVKRAAERLVEVTHEAMMRGIEAIRPGRHHRRHRLRHPGLRRARALQRRPRFLRPRRRPAVPRRAEHPALRLARRRRRAEGRDDLHRRADDQSRPAAGEDPVRRLDRGHPRPLALGPVRAYGRRHRDRLRDLHAVAAGPRAASPDGA